MKISGIIAQLRALAPIFNGNVAGAAAYGNGVSDQVFLTLPSAYVIPLGQEAGANESQPGLWQIVTKKIGVIIVLDNSIDPADRRGQGASDQIDLFEEAICGAILNWRPDWDYTATPAQNLANNIEARGFYLTGAELIDFDRARFFYRFDFAIDTVLTDQDGWQQPSVPLVKVELEFVAQKDGRPLGTFAVDPQTS